MREQIIIFIVDIDRLDAWIFSIKEYLEKYKGCYVRVTDCKLGCKIIDEMKIEDLTNI